MGLSREEVVWTYRCLLGREPESEAVIEGHRRAHSSLASLRRVFITSTEFSALLDFTRHLSDGASRTPAETAASSADRNDRRPFVLVQNFHPSATRALIRDFTAIGLRVICPDSNWFFSRAYEPNAGLGAELISFKEYMCLPPGRLLIGCKEQEYEMRRLAQRRNDLIILNVAQHHQYYEAGISRALICPDVITFENYPDDRIRKLLYFFRPYVSTSEQKNLRKSFEGKTVCSYINRPDYWPLGSRALDDFRRRYRHEVMQFGSGAANGPLDHVSCNTWMVRSFLTVHFKELEAYGLSCLESMSLGTPIVTLKRFMYDKTLGRFFLNDANSICAETVDEAIERINSISFGDYKKMSLNCAKTVRELTSDEKNLKALREAIFY